LVTEDFWLVVVTARNEDETEIDERNEHVNAGVKIHQWPE